MLTVVSSFPNIKFAELVETRNSRIKKALDDKRISQEKLSSELGVSRSAVSERLNSEKEVDSYEFLAAVSKLTGYAIHWLSTGYGPEQVTVKDLMHQRARELDQADDIEDKDVKYLVGNAIRPITVTVSQSGQELVSYVPVKAQAGYMRGYADPHFIERLPAFSLPGVIKDQATYRMFEVNGESMLQLGSKGLKSGDIIIARYLEDIFSLKDNRVYVMVSQDGVAIKRVLNRLKDKESPCLVLMSDNKNGDYPNYLLKPKQILEVWEAKKVISSDFSFDTDLYQMLGDLQTEQAKMREKINELAKK